MHVVGAAAGRVVPLSTNLFEIVVPVPASKWGSLGLSSPWEDFRAGVARIGPTVRRFAPTAVLGVDWHGMAAINALPSPDTEASWVIPRLDLQTYG